MAAALFSGLAPGAPAATSSLNRAPTQPKAAPAAAPVAAPSKRADDEDFLSMSFGAAPAPVAAAAPAPVKAPVDDLDLLLGGSFGAPAPKPAAVSADPLDFLSGMASAAPAAAAPAAVPAAVTQRLSALNVTSRDSAVVLAADANVQISVVRGRADAATVWTVLLTRLGGAPIRSSALHVPVPASLRLAAAPEAVPAAPAGGAPLPAGMVGLPPLDVSAGPAAVLISVVLAAPRLPTAGGFVVTLGYVDPVSNARVALKASLDAAFADVVRPAPITTEQFGGGWKQFTQEAKFQV